MPAKLSQNLVEPAEKRRPPLTAMLKPETKTLLIKSDLVELSQLPLAPPPCSHRGATNIVHVASNLGHCASPLSIAAS